MPSRSRQTGYRCDANGAANATSRVEKRFRVDSRAPQNHPRRTSKDKIIPRCDAESGFESVEGDARIEGLRDECNTRCDRGSAGPLLHSARFGVAGGEAASRRLPAVWYCILLLEIKPTP